MPASYNDKRRLKGAMARWTFVATHRAHLKRGDYIIDNGQLRQVAATFNEPVIPSEASPTPARGFLAFEGDPKIRPFEYDLNSVGAGDLVVKAVSIEDASTDELLDNMT